MNIIDTRLVAILVTTVLAGLGVAHLCGIWRLEQTPESIRHLSSGAGDRFLASPMYFVGFSYALFLVFVTTFVPSLIVAAISRLKSGAAVKIVRQLMLNTLVSGALFLVAGYFVFRASAH